MGIRVTERSEIEPAVKKAREAEGSVVLEFRIEEEDMVYPMVPAGAGSARNAPPAGNDPMKKNREELICSIH